jgi:Flp pilus assembly protein TadB
VSDVLVVALVAGAVAGLGLWIVVRQFAPAHIDLGAALDNLTPRSASAPSTVSWQERWGAGAQRALPGLAVPRADLAITRTPAHRWLGEKVMLGLVGLSVPVVLAGLVALAGVPLPVFIPVGASLALAGGLFLLPDLRLRERAARERAEFSRAVAVYVELVALERRAASGTVQAMESAATVADTWAFERLREQLFRARLDGTTPWTALAELAQEVRVPELADFAGTMRLAGEESAQVYHTLRSQARTLRTGMLSAEHARANAASDSMSAPAAMGGMAFLALLMAPALMRML